MQTTDQMKTESAQQMEDLGTTYGVFMATALGTIELAKTRLVNEAITVQTASQGKGSFFNGWDAKALKESVTAALEEVACGLDELARGFRQMKEAIERDEVL